MTFEIDPKTLIALATVFFLVMAAWVVFEGEE